MNIKRKVAIGASALAAFTSIVLITNQASANGTPSVTPPVVSSQNVPSVDATGAGEVAGDNIQSGDQTTPDVAGATGDAGATDGDNIQSGDQTTPDVAGATDAGSSN
jgi:hypothetical protein